MKNVSLEKMLDSTSLLLALENLHLANGGESTNWLNQPYNTYYIAKAMRVDHYKQLMESVDWEAAITFFGMQHKPYYNFYSDLIRVNNAWNRKPIEGSPATLMTLNDAFKVFCVLIITEINKRLQALIHDKPC